MNLSWTRRLPFAVFRRGCPGFLVELTVVLVLLVAFGLIGHFCEILPNLADPFEYHEPPLPDWCLNTTCLLELDVSFPYTWAAAVGIGSWISVYVVALKYKFDSDYDARHRPICSYEVCRDRRAAASCAHIFYHAVRWPILLGMAASGDPLIITFGYWIDAMALAAALLIYGLVKAMRPSPSVSKATGDSVSSVCTPSSAEISEPE